MNNILSNCCLSVTKSLRSSARSIRKSALPSAEPTDEKTSEVAWIYKPGPALVGAGSTVMAAISLSVR
jgi:hypothetical protein